MVASHRNSFAFNGAKSATAWYRARTWCFPQRSRGMLTWMCISLKPPVSSDGDPIGSPQGQCDVLHPIIAEIPKWL